MEDGLKALILSDGRIGHQSQSEAFCKLKGIEYDIVFVSYKFRILKILAYVFDFLRIYLPIFNSSCLQSMQKYLFVVSAGSTTYYANKFFARKFKLKNIALMSPKGFRNDFSLVFSTLHDKIDSKNAVNLPVNLNYLAPKNYYNPSKKAIGFIIGGDNKSFYINESIVNDIKSIKDKFKDYEFLITTSPRTPKFIENALLNQRFDFFVLYERDRINPIYDFLKYCEFVFITQDSVSMISEAVCNLNASVAVFKLPQKRYSLKFDNFIKNLQSLNLICIYKTYSDLKKTKKLNLKEIIDKVNI